VLLENCTVSYKSDQQTAITAPFHAHLRCDAKNMIRERHPCNRNGIRAERPSDGAGPVRDAKPLR
jgi:hypothetical protein